MYLGALGCCTLDRVGAGGGELLCRMASHRAGWQPLACEDGVQHACRDVSLRRDLRRAPADSVGRCAPSCRESFGSSEAVSATPRAHSFCFHAQSLWRPGGALVAPPVLRGKAGWLGGHALLQGHRRSVRIVARDHLRAGRGPPLQAGDRGQVGPGRLRSCLQGPRHAHGRHACAEAAAEGSCSWHRRPRSPVFARDQACLRGAARANLPHSPLLWHSHGALRSRSKSRDLGEP
mmetsp:Transcript_90642/g.253237  ORF Transcript_90642/g.253237 Transcript_90642/m.253237 type:complete len:234 (-) Transcript_90642:725-1426(-)